jgi:hypothetical protein
MLSKPEQSTILTEFILDFSDNSLSRAELSSFKELMDRSEIVRREAIGSKRIRIALGSMPKVSTSDRFDQKMASRFAIELQKEAKEQNAKRIGEKKLTTI